MNKAEFIDHISKQHDCTKQDAEKIINIFTSSVSSALSVGAGTEISLIGFGKFYASQVEARTGRNPKTGAVLQIDAYVQPRFSSGSSLREACNSAKLKKK